MIYGDFVGQALTQLESHQLKTGNLAHSLKVRRWFKSKDGFKPVTQKVDYYKDPNFLNHQIQPGDLLHLQGEVSARAGKDGKAYLNFKANSIENISAMKKASSGLPPPAPVQQYQQSTQPSQQQYQKPVQQNYQPTYEDMPFY